MKKIFFALSVVALFGFVACQQAEVEVEEVTFVEPDHEVILSAEDYDWELFNDGTVMFSYPSDFVLVDGKEKLSISNDDFAISFYPVPEMLEEDVRPDVWRKYSKNGDDYYVMVVFFAGLEEPSENDLNLLEEIFSTFSVI